MLTNLNTLQAYWQNIRQANTEAAKKELFYPLLSALFQDDAAATESIARMAQGAEKRVDIPLPDRVKSGRADTQYNAVIIEWEKELKKTGAHAAEQLREYLAGNWRGGAFGEFTLIATDGLEWRIYAPDYERSLYLQEDWSAADLQLVAVNEFSLNETNLAEFPWFIDRYLFKTVLLRPTLQSIAEDFGQRSKVFRESMRRMRGHIGKLQDDSALDTAYEQWRKFLSIAYGQFDASTDMFLIHSYLSAFAKLLAFVVLSRETWSEDETLHRVLEGGEFESRFRVSRFVENDFFQWFASPKHFSALLPVLRDITAKLSEYDFSQAVQEDILKGVYQELIDLETRHALGEYYTPDWLCEKIMADLPVQRNSTILDPACGSGSFLRAAVLRLKQAYPDLSPNELAEQVVGIDIHPLSVQIAKTTLLLSLDITKEAPRRKNLIPLLVYLSNTILLPDNGAGLFGSVYHVYIDNRLHELDMSVFDKPGQFDSVIDMCDMLANPAYDSFKKADFIHLLNTKLGINNPIIADQFHRVLLSFKHAREEGRDGIWRYIVQNLYKPVFLKKYFDFIAGNPPWLTYGGVRNPEYQKKLYALADSYHLIPASKANMPQLEIAAIFLAHAANYFLKENGKLAFVLPRSFLTADQHHNTRSGEVGGLKLTEIWDLEKVSPLFRVPSCVLWANYSAEREVSQRQIPAEGIPGFSVAGRLSKAQLDWTLAQNNLEFTPDVWKFLALKRKGRSAFSNQAFSVSGNVNYYARLFKNGATIYPRSFYFVENKYTPLRECDSGMNIIVNTDENILKESKLPWRDIKLTDKIETDFLFFTALAKNVLPFLLVNPPLVLLPLVIKTQSGNTSIELCTSEQLMKKLWLYTGGWFKKAEVLWDEYKTEYNRNKNMNLYNWLNWQQKLTKQDLSKQFVVLYTASGKDACSVVLDRNTLKFNFFAENKTYWFATENQSEAFYLCAFFNSGYANKKIKLFQSRGLFGARDIHKKILDIPFPRFDAKKKNHKELAELAQVCAVKAKNLLGDTRSMDLNPHDLGRLRLRVREELQEEMQRIDAIVEKLSG